MFILARKLSSIFFFPSRSPPCFEEEDEGVLGCGLWGPFFFFYVNFGIGEGFIGGEMGFYSRRRELGVK